MRASTVIALSVVAGSASFALAAPRHFGRQESGALSFDDIKNGAKTVLGDVTKVAQTVAPAITTVSKFADAVAPFFEKREDAELFARTVYEARADESGALSWQDVKDFGKGFVDGFTGTINAVLPAVGAVTDLVGAVNGAKGGKREDLELLARHFARDYESGALSWQDVKDFGKGFVDGFTGTLNAVLPAVGAVTDAVNAFNGKGKRDEGQLMGLAARAAIGQFPGIQGINHGPIRIPPFINKFPIGTVKPLPVIARQVPSAPLDGSGALSFQDVKDFGKGFVDGFTGTLKTLAPVVTAFIKREDLELLARQEFLKRATVDESGALSFQDVKDFGKGFVQGFTGTIEKLAPVVTAFLKREELELVARETLMTAYAKRSLAELD